ncbi:Pentatricopeptide repeat-containing protein [Heracleum sosnowskyi]|uniref:Pentatricopeptide repeat-containing protein n=1 Tax=Heracleum sosnowskyi TaxID=360622 RepID=A0AAD8I4V5_9APIA|nr:Pentatricopeptide repeat-containing protein [Heracleum sosnowskyi]
MTCDMRLVNRICCNASRNLSTAHQHPFHLSRLQNIVQTCAENRAITQGIASHSQIIQLGHQSDTLTSNMLINMYSKCGLLNQARHVFDQMPERSPVSWNTIIGAYTQNGSESEAFRLFMHMQREAASEFSEFTVSSVLCACAAKCAVLECKQLHAFSLKASIDSNSFVATALVDVYAKCNLIRDSILVFESMSEKSDVMWSSMVAGYVQNEFFEEAILLFHRSRVTGLEHNQYIFSSVISACAALASLIEGNQVHAVLHKSEFKNVVLWNAMISGFSRHACSIQVMVLFEKMQQMCLRPNEVTYVSVLSACGHMGMVEKGRKYFDMMTKEHNVSPNVYHYSCMVDVLGRKGLINEAKDLIDDMPFDATASMWGSLLASCRVYGNVELAEVAAKQLFEIEPHNAGNHVLLSNVYAADKRWEDVASARKLLKDSEAKKERGKSWIASKDKVHTFMVGERSHPKISEIYSKLEDLLEEMKKLGYKGETKHDLHNVEDYRKEQLLWHHSEKLALAFGLLYLPSCAPIRIMKNLRICGDCHLFMKLASSITGRKIIVRDNNRFHHFGNGSCSCGEFW